MIAAADHAQPLPRRRAPLAWIIPLLLVCWTAGMLVLTMAPLEEMRAGISFSFTKLGHTVLFFGWTVLAGLYVMVFRGHWALRLVPLLIAGTLFGVAIELLQLLLPFGRSAQLLDVMMNSIGAAAGCLVLHRVRRRHGRHALQAKSRTT